MDSVTEVHGHGPPVFTSDGQQGSTQVEVDINRWVAALQGRRGGARKCPKGQCCLLGYQEFTTVVEEIERERNKKAY